MAPGRGAPGRGATGAELNGLLPTRGVLWTGALGPGLGPARSSAAAAAAGSAAAENSAGLPCSLAGTGAWAAGATAAAGASGVAGCATAGCTAAGSCTGGASAAASSGLGPGRGPGRTPAGAAFAAGAVASTFAVASTVATGAAGNAPRRRRATGASTVDDADFTNSPCSFSLASTSLLVTPSSFASSCTRALPATALLTGRPGGKIRTTSVYNRRTFITEASRGAHEFFACLPRWTCSVFTGPP